MWSWSRLFSNEQHFVGKRVQDPSALFSGWGTDRSAPFVTVLLLWEGTLAQVCLWPWLVKPTYFIQNLFSIKHFWPAKTSRELHLRQLQVWSYINACIRAATSHLFVLKHCHWLKGLENSAQSLTLVRHLNRECVASHRRIPGLTMVLVNVDSSKETFTCFDRYRSPLLSACWRKAENREREPHLKRAKRREKRPKKWVLPRLTNPVSVFL